MKLLRSLATHSAVLVAATVFALAVWNREDAEGLDSEANVQVWPGSAETVERISYESDKTKVRIDRRQAAHDRPVSTVLSDRGIGQGNVYRRLVHI